MEAAGSLGSRGENGKRSGRLDACFSCSPWCLPRSKYAGPKLLGGHVVDSSCPYLQRYFSRALPQSLPLCPEPLCQKESIIDRFALVAVSRVMRRFSPMAAQSLRFVITVYSAVGRGYRTVRRPSLYGR